MHVTFFKTIVDHPIMPIIDVINTYIILVKKFITAIPKPVLGNG